MPQRFSRRSFLASGAGAAAFAALSGAQYVKAQDAPQIQGFDETKTDVAKQNVWEPFTDRKLRIGIAGFGLCQFGAQFGLQNHPNAEVVAVTDLFADRRDGLAKACRCEKTYESLEKMLEDDSIEAVFVATDAPSHCDHVLKALKAGKHVACAVPAVWGSLEDAARLFDAVQTSGLTYAMFETSAYHDAVYASRQIYRAGGFGRMIYTEGEYYHYGAGTLPGYKDWRRGLPPQWYPTHSNAYYTCVTGGAFSSVSCVGWRSKLEEYQKGANPYDNPFGTEIALFETNEGGAARMAVSWDSAGWGGEVGRNRGEIGAYQTSFEPLNDEAKEIVAKLGELRKPALPPNVDAGGHGGSHGYLGSNFIESVLKEERPTVDVALALNTTVPGIVAHMSALKDGERLPIPQFELD